ncbi:hypothetical protein MRX96_024162 [Rhipicephalus microplus]
MRQLLGEKASKIDASILSQLFLQHLPANVCMVFAAAGNLPLDDPAVLSDKVLEVATPTISALEIDVVVGIGDDDEPQDRPASLDGSQVAGRKGTGAPEEFREKKHAEVKPQIAEEGAEAESNNK